jgi:hypothetical protein
MTSDTSQHERFFHALGACVQAHVLEDALEMKAFHARFEQHPDNWTRALACGFYRIGSQQLNSASQEFADEVEFVVSGRSIGTFSCSNPPDFYDLSGDFFVDFLFSERLKDTKTIKTKLNVVSKGFDAVLKYDQTNAALSLEEMKFMAGGLGTLLLYYQPFYVESQREGILGRLCHDVVEDLLGEWPQ